MPKNTRGHARPYDLRPENDLRAHGARTSGKKAPLGLTRYSTPVANNADPANRKIRPVADLRYKNRKIRDIGGFTHNAIFSINLNRYAAGCQEIRRGGAEGAMFGD